MPGRRSAVVVAGLALVLPDRTGQTPPGSVFDQQLSGNGRFATFMTDRPDLDPHETAARSTGSVYERELTRRTTTLVSGAHPGGVCETLPS